MQYEGVIPEHRAVRTDCRSSTCHTWASSTSTTRLRRSSSRRCSRTTSARSRRRGPVHAAHERARRDRRRPHRLPARARPVPARRQRVEPRGGLRLAEGARAAWTGGGDAPTSTACSRSRARARSSVWGSRAAGVHARDGRDRRHRGDGRAHRVHGRARRRALLRGGRRGGSGTRSSRGAVPCGLGARDTPDSRSATRCTATTSRRTRTRSPRASVGRARSTRTSPGRTCLRRVKEGPGAAARPVRHGRRRCPARACRSRAGAR